MYLFMGKGLVASEIYRMFWRLIVDNRGQFPKRMI